MSDDTTPMYQPQLLDFVRFWCIFCIVSFTQRGRFWCAACNSVNRTCTTSTLLLLLSLFLFVLQPLCSSTCISHHPC